MTRNQRYATLRFRELKSSRLVIMTQLTKKSVTRMKKNLILGESPIIEFRKRRAALRQAEPAAK